MRLTFIISSLGVGGAERIISGLANALCQQGQQVTLITLAPSVKDHYELRPEIQRISTNIFWQTRNWLSGLASTLKRLQIIRKTVVDTQPDVVVSFIDLTNIRVVAALIGSGIPVVVSERVDPTRHNIGKIWSLLRRCIYPFAAHVVMQTRSTVVWANTFLEASNVSVIPNFVNAVNITTEQPRPHAMPVGRPVIIAAGRLVRQKGFDLLIEAFAESALVTNGWQLVILGEGEERSQLEQQVMRLRLCDHVYLPGTVSTPELWFCHADIFVLSSRYEGFPNVLMESMACGLPSIAFDCRSGPSEIIEDGVSGLLVPLGDTELLTQSMIRLASDREMMKRLSLEAINVMERFSIEQVLQQWLHVFKTVRR